MVFDNIFEKEWSNQGTTPSDELASNGFEGGMKPPAGVFNWFWCKTIKAIKELQSKLSITDSNANETSEKLDSLILKKNDRVYTKVCLGQLTRKAGEYFDLSLPLRRFLPPNLDIKVTNITLLFSQEVNNYLRMDEFESGTDFNINVLHHDWFPDYTSIECPADFTMPVLSNGIDGIDYTKPVTLTIQIQATVIEREDD